MSGQVRSDLPPRVEHRPIARVAHVVKRLSPRTGLGGAKVTALFMDDEATAQALTDRKSVV